MPSDLDVAREAAAAGADRVRAAFGAAGEPSFKTSSVDPVTETDRAAEAAVLDVIRRHRPDDATLGEESGGAGWDRGRVWITDPLDGTVNFIHGIPHVAVSVAVWEDGVPLAGVVADAIHPETFAAARGQGATLDGVTIRPSACRELGRALVGTGFPYDRRQRADVYGAVFTRVLSEVQGVRRTGSAALDMCYVACGRFDGYWEEGLAPWDAAAALLVNEEAGARHSAFGGGTYRLGTGGVVITNGLIHDSLSAVVGTGT